MNGSDDDNNIASDTQLMNDSFQTEPQDLTIKKPTTTTTTEVIVNNQLVVNTEEEEEEEEVVDNDNNNSSGKEKVPIIGDKTTTAVAATEDQTIDTVCHKKQSIADTTDNDGSSGGSTTKANGRRFPTLDPRDPQLLQVVHQLVADLYDRNHFWEQISDVSKGEEILNSMKSLVENRETIAKQSSTSTSPSAPTDSQTAKKLKTMSSTTTTKSIVNCDNEANHLLNKLKFINELIDGKTSRIQSEITAFQMKDFQTN